MKVWRRAAGGIKDRVSLIAAADDKLTAEIIKATSHDDLSMDIENAQLIYRHIQRHPSSFKPFIRAISLRVERTRNWTVALKSLILIHGLFLAGNPAVESIGRLPFDLSGFGKTKSRFSRTGRFNVFVRAYFAFLDGRSILFFDDRDRNNEITIRLEIIVKMQRIVESLMRIKPIEETMETPLVIEAMEHVTTEILEINGQIRRGFADFLSDVGSNPGKSESEAGLAMKIVAKSLLQGEELLRYFEFCRGFGVTNAREIPDFVRISESDVLVLGKLNHNSPELDRTARVTPVEMAETDSVTGERSKILETAYRRRDDNTTSDLISF